MHKNHIPFPGGKRQQQQQVAILYIDLLMKFKLTHLITVDIFQLFTKK